MKAIGSFCARRSRSCRNISFLSDVYRILRPPARSPGGVQLPQLTIGNIMLSQARLMALPLSAEQQAELADITSQMDQVRSEWRANWGIKAEREFASRLNLWQQYLRELRSDPRQQMSFYASEVRNRVILQMLRTELPGQQAQQDGEQLEMMDQILRGNTRAGDFVWEEELAAGFPKETFWFLYLAVRQ
jgi:hypothetical protein